MMRARGPSRRSLGWSEYLSVTLRADRGYNGVLTLNPAWPGPEYETSYLRAWPWELRELGEIIPDGWRIPAVPATAIGRNVALFKWAVKEAHRPAAGSRGDPLPRFQGLPLLGADRRSQEPFRVWRLPPLPA